MASKLKKLNISIVGAGYVGMSISVLLSKDNNVVIFDIDRKKIDLINSGISTIPDNEIVSLFNKNNIKIQGTTDEIIAYRDADIIIIAVPTDYDQNKDGFDTSSVDFTVNNILKINPNCLIVIKSTIPIGHTNYLQNKYKTKNIIFSPEFLREGKALYDNLYPSRIVVSNCSKMSKSFADILLNASSNKDASVHLVTAKEAESIKLFSNTYLAMRVSFFNELDTFAIKQNLNPKNIIKGVSSDSRIGDFYNNPSFGYGGYCLPKDTRQLLKNYKGIPQTIIEAIVSSNSKRKEFIAKKIYESSGPSKIIGVYRLLMKSKSNNFKSSAVLGVLNRLELHIDKSQIILYEPYLSCDSYNGYKVIKDLNIFKALSDLIISNRNHSDLDDVKEKCFSRDIFGED